MAWLTANGAGPGCAHAAHIAPRGHCSGYRSTEAPGEALVPRVLRQHIKSSFCTKTPSARQDNFKAPGGNQQHGRPKQTDRGRGSPRGPPGQRQAGQAEQKRAQLGLNSQLPSYPALVPGVRRLQKKKRWFQLGAGSGNKRIRQATGRAGAALLGHPALGCQSRFAVSEPRDVRLAAAEDARGHAVALGPRRRGQLLSPPCPGLARALLIAPHPSQSYRGTRGFAGSCLCRCQPREAELALEAQHRPPASRLSPDTEPGLAR